MKSFSQFLEDFLYEAKKKSQALSSNVSQDDKGKLHELLLAKHLHPDGTLPSHHRDKNGKSPQDVHDALRAKIGEDAYHEINEHARSTAHAVREHMRANGHHDDGHEIHDVTWTSNADSENKAGDHQKTTKVKDTNSNADLIVTTKHPKTGEKRYVGVSAKYGSQKPNYRNPGMKAMEDHSGKHGEFTGLLRDHNKRMEHLGYTGTLDERHAQHKADKKAAAAGDKEAGARVSAAEKSSLDARREISRRYAHGLNSGTREEAHSRIRSLMQNAVSPETVHPHIVAHSHVQQNGSSIPSVKKAENIAPEHFDNYHSLSAEHTGGVSTHIYGIHKQTGKKTKLATLSVKGSSGPHKGFSGTVGLS